MLEHSPPLPLFIDYCDTGYGARPVIAKVEEDISLAIQQRDRVRRIRLRMTDQYLRRIVTALDGEFPILEYLFIKDHSCSDSSGVILPQSLQAPRLRCLILYYLDIPFGFLLQTAAVDVVTFSLQFGPNLEIHYPRNDLLTCLSILSKLEILDIGFPFGFFDEGFKEQFLPMSIKTHITFPKLHSFSFQGPGCYLDALLCRITTPLLERFWSVLTGPLSIPCIHFTTAAEKLRFTCARINFGDSPGASLSMYPSGWSDDETSVSEPFRVCVDGRHLGRQVESLATISNALRPLFSEVDTLNLEIQDRMGHTSRRHVIIDPAQWRNLLKPFNSVKTLDIFEGLVRALDRILQPEDGVSSLELFPELKELSFPANDETDHSFAGFIRARQNAGRPVFLFCRHYGPRYTLF
jgi:hypothetical protein